MILSGLLMNACATTNGHNFSSDDPETAIHFPHAEKVNSAVLANKFALMALFAKTVYRKDLLSNDALNERSCEYLNHSKHRDIWLDMPRNADGSGWKRWGISGSCYNLHGLFFETYVHQKIDGTVDEAVIAIRGTETGSMQQFKDDVKASLSGAFKLKNNEYLLAEQNILPVIVSLKQIYGCHLKVYLTGHSLGGGIAQQIAYMSKDVTETFVFNTSPVTNWKRLNDEGKITNEDPVIYRIWQNHEFLEYIRKITSAFNLPRLSRDDYELYFVKQGIGGSHSMSHLTCQLAARVAETGAEHDYSYQSAAQTLNSPILCPNDILENINKPLQIMPMNYFQF